MSDAIRAFTPGDIYARTIDPSKFRTRAVNSCWPAPPRAAPAELPPPECARPRCRRLAVDDGWCEPHAAEEREWRALDVAALRDATHGMTTTEE